VTEIRTVDVKQNKIIYTNGDEVTFQDVKNKLDTYLSKRFVGQTVSLSDMERFMKKSSSKNLKQLLDVKKTEGTLEALIGKKLDPRWIKIILFMALIGVGILILFMILPKLGIL